MISYVDKFASSAICMHSMLCATKKFLQWKKRSERRKQCAPKIFTTPQTPFPGVQDRQNLISWRWSLPAPTDPVWWRLMHTISSYRGNRHCPPTRCTHTQTGPITIHCTARLSAQCNKSIDTDPDNFQNSMVTSVPQDISPAKFSWRSTQQVLCEVANKQTSDKTYPPWQR